MASIDELVPQFQKDLSDLIAKWQGDIGRKVAQGEEITPEESDAQMRIICAGHIALAMRTKVVEQAARPFYDRNGWRFLEKHIEDTAREHSKRPADGLKGLRAVK